MLRSLVGSEMCIRDSTGAGGRLRQDHEGAGPLAQEHNRHRPVGALGGTREGVSEGCLLYTSDAADDLLCVDLGGRRIIKKKKIE